VPASPAAFPVHLSPTHLPSAAASEVLRDSVLAALACFCAAGPTGAATLGTVLGCSAFAGWLALVLSSTAQSLPDATGASAVTMMAVARGWPSVICSGCSTHALKRCLETCMVLQRCA
jgi:hypothetical protein